MAKGIVRAMPNMLAKNSWAQIGLLLLLLAGGMIFFAGSKLNTLIEEAFQTFGIDGVGSFFGMLIIALMIATGGYYLMKRIKK